MEDPDDECAGQLPETPILLRLRERREVRRPQEDDRVIDKPKGLLD